jgi:hypothetical protein
LVSNTNTECLIWLIQGTNKMSDEGFGINNLDDRVRLLERRIVEMDALMKGLTDEMLDMKAVVMKLKKEQRPPPVIQAVVPPVSRGKVEKEKEERASEKESGKQTSHARDKITLKMQPDGTLQPEAETGEDIIIASPRDTRSRLKDQGRSGQSDLIIADERDPSEGSS